MPAEGPDLEGLIRLRYPAGEWAVVFELNKGTGARGQEGRIDAAAFNCWPSKGFHRLAFEIKRSRSDFARELDRPKKREWVEKNFHQTWFVAPGGLVKPDEIPESWGLLVATNGGELRCVKQAMHREIGPMPEELALSAIRALASGLEGERSKRFHFDGGEISAEDLRLKVDELVEIQRDTLERLVADTQKRKQALDHERAVLIEPLRVLARAALGWSEAMDVVPHDTEPVTVTVEQVRDWIVKAASPANGEFLPLIKRARDALSELIGDDGARRRR